MRENIRRNKKPGFTLVELLIVIIIIGILAGGMMLVAGGSTDKANATKIVSNLRTMKSAALMYYSDNTATGWPTDIDDLKPYIDRTISDDYKISTSGDLIGYDGALIGTANSGVNEKLEEMAVDSGLYKGDGENKYEAGDISVWMRIR